MNNRAKSDLICSMWLCCYKKHDVGKGHELKKKPLVIPIKQKEAFASLKEDIVSAVDLKEAVEAVIKDTGTEIEPITVDVREDMKHEELR